MDRKPDLIGLIGLQDSKVIGLNKFLVNFFLNKIGELKDFSFLYARLKNGTYYVRGMASLRKLFCFQLTPPTVTSDQAETNHDVEQRILFRGYSPPNVCRVMPLWKFL